MTEPRRTVNRRAELTEQVRAVIRAYAIFTPRGAMLCDPKPIEVQLHGADGHKPWRGNNGKVCYPDQVAADSARDGINALNGDPVETYPCPRGGHWHLVDQAGRRAWEEATIRKIASAARRAEGRVGGPA